MITNNHGLLVEGDRCLGYLFNFRGKGIYSPDGKVEVSEEDVNTHNRTLSEAELKGLDKNCQVGQGGTFYYVKGEVTTFVGVKVSELVRVSGKVITFSRNGKVFTGRLRKDADCFNFRRIK